MALLLFLALAACKTAAQKEVPEVPDWRRIRGIRFVYAPFMVEGSYSATISLSRTAKGLFSGRWQSRSTGMVGDENRKQSNLFAHFECVNVQLDDQGIATAMQCRNPQDAAAPIFNIVMNKRGLFNADMNKSGKLPSEESNQPYYDSASEHSLQDAKMEIIP